MRTILIKLAAGFISFLCVIAPALSDDVEIFFNVSPETTGDPLVMFSLDYRPNTFSSICNFTTSVTECGWDNGIANDADDDFYFGYTDDSGNVVTGFYDTFTASDMADNKITFLEQLRAALRYVFKQPSILGKVRVGLMLNHNNVNNCEGQSVTNGCSNGGYIAMKFTKTGGAAPDNGEVVLDATLAALPIAQGSVAHPNQGKELYYEFHNYLTGGEIYNGHVGRVDYGDACGSDNLNNTNPSSCGGGGDVDVDPLVSWDESAEETDAGGALTGNYESPFTDMTLQCSSAYAMNFMFGVSSQDSDSDAKITADLTGIDLQGSNNKFTTVIDWLYKDSAGAARDLIPGVDGNQNVTSYFFFKGNVQNTMDGYAIAGGTGQANEITDDPKAAVESIVSAFEEIIRQNATFEAPAVTVNSYTRLTHRDELFYALFGPELDNDWPGNLKKYKLGRRDTDTDGDGVNDTVTVRIEDKYDNQAVDPIEGTFKVSACSFWSDCSIDRDSDNTADPDGDVVAWGGAAEKLPSDGSRLVYTDSSGALVALNSSNVTHSQLGISTGTDPNVTDATPSCSIAECIADMDGDGDVDSADHDALRVQILNHLNDQTIGDPIHARPAVIEYDADFANQGATPDLALAMSTNEGFFHLFNAATGAEYSAYMPSELLAHIKKINGPSSISGTATTRWNAYGLDGSPVVRTYDDDSDGRLNDGNDLAHVYLTQRRGGRNIYALNILNKTNPSFLWKIVGGTGSFSNLGQTWSTPQLAKLKSSSGDIDVLVFGGGYDPAQDSTYQLADAYGNSIYVVNATTGALIWEVTDTGSSTLNIADMNNSIPADVKTIDIDQDGYLDRIYAVDVVGRIFRVDFDNSGSDTTVAGGGLLASLNKSDSTTTCATGGAALDGAVIASCQRRFYNALDTAIMTGYPVSPYLQISVGSGYRAHPVTVTGIQDRFYALFDENVVNTVATANYATEYHWAEDDLVNVTEIDTSGGAAGATPYNTASSNLQVALTQSGVHGWYLDMEGEQEKVLSESVTLGGKTVFTTYLRDTNNVDVCKPNLGKGRIYVVDAFNGLPVADLTTGTIYDDANAQTPVKGDRYKDLGRDGIPSDPLVVFRKDETGKIVPIIVVSTELPLPEDLFGSNNYVETWWMDAE